MFLLYKGSDEEVIVPSTVTKIKGAFLREDEYPYPLKVKKVFVPDSVTYISAYSFSGQEGIEVYIPETVKLIGESEEDLYIDTIFGSYDEDAGTIVTTSGSPAEAYAIEEDISYRIITKEEMQQEMEAAKNDRRINRRSLHLKKRETLMKETLTVIFSNQNTGKEMDLEIPLYITADELIQSLNQAL